MAQFEEVFQALSSLKEELYRLRRVEQEYRRLKREYEALLKQVRVEGRGLTVKPEEGFYFCKESGVYTGHSALNFEEFCEAFNKLPLKSIEFHSSRGDFEKWLRFIGMNDLAREFEAVRISNLSGEPLRQRLVEAMKKAVVA